MKKWAGSAGLGFRLTRAEFFPAFFNLSLEHVLNQCPLNPELGEYLKTRSPTRPEYEEHIAETQRRFLDALLSKIQSDLTAQGWTLVRTEPYIYVLLTSTCVALTMANLTVGVGSRWQYTDTEQALLKSTETKVRQLAQFWLILN